MRKLRTKQRGSKEELQERARVAVEALDPLAADELLTLPSLDEEQLRAVIQYARAARAALNSMYGALGVEKTVLDLAAARPAEVAKRRKEQPERAVTPPEVTKARPVPACAAVSVGGLTPTSEQGAVIDVCSSGENLVVEAGAGSGKTTTLKMAATVMKNRRGLYLAFNKAIATDARKSFPSQVTCSTAHALAWRAVGRDYAHRFNIRVPARRVAEVLRILEPLRVDAHLVLAPEQLARMASETVDTYCHSADREIRPVHVPRLEGVAPRDMDALRGELVPHARRMWEEAQRIDSPLRYPHDYYLKRWALGNPQLPCDYVLLDEAQDSNPVIAHLVQSQQSQRIAVGDSAQAIYGWRGAVDALATWPAKHRLYLQQSWRFGQAVADHANLWLQEISSPIRLIGNPGRASVVGLVAAPDAVLCRTNAEAVSRAMSALEAGRRPALVGGGRQIRALAEAALDLQAGKATAHPELVAFASWDQLRQYVRDEQAGRDLAVFVKLIDDHGPESVIDTVKNLVEERYADVVLSTAHKAKGREWGSVAIAGDFTPPRQEDGVYDALRRDEAMLAYVAVTRGKDALDTGGLSWIHDYLDARRRGQTGGLYATD